MVPPTGGTLHGIGLQLLQAMRGVPQSGRAGGEGGPSRNFLHGRVRGRRPDPALLVPDASRQEAEANLRFAVFRVSNGLN